MWKILCLLSLAVAFVSSKPMPQFEDMQTTGIIMAGQVKDVIDNGAAVKDGKEFEFMGAKISNQFSMGFGDAMGPSGRKRRETVTIIEADDTEVVVVEDDDSDDDSSSSSSEEEELTIIV